MLRWVTKSSPNHQILTAEAMKMLLTLPNLREHLQLVENFSVLLIRLKHLFQM